VLLFRSVVLQWSEFEATGRVGNATPNKLVLVPDLPEEPRLVVISFCHRPHGSGAEGM
jgi:hypothetical protein